jgi:hypothetical protein
MTKVKRINMQTRSTIFYLVFIPALFAKTMAAGVGPMILLSDVSGEYDDATQYGLGLSLNTADSPEKTTGYTGALIYARAEYDNWDVNAHKFILANALTLSVLHNETFRAWVGPKLDLSLEKIEEEVYLSVGLGPAAGLDIFLNDATFIRGSAFAKYAYWYGGRYENIDEWENDASYNQADSGSETEIGLTLSIHFQF